MIVKRGGDERKRCSRCKRLLPIGMFYRESRSRDGLRSECIPCRNSGARRVKAREKECPSCGRTLPIEMFHADRRRPDRARSLCVDCRRADAKRIVSSIAAVLMDEFGLEEV